MKKFLCSVNLFAFIPMMLFMVKNCYTFSKWVYRGMVKSFLLKIIREQNTLLLPYIHNLLHHIKNKLSKLC